MQPFVVDGLPGVSRRDGLVTSSTDRSHKGLPSPNWTAATPSVTVPIVRRPDLPKRAGVPPATTRLVQPGQSLAFFVIMRQRTRGAPL